MRTRQPWQTGVQSVCPRCKQSHVAEKSYSDTVEFRNLTLDVEGLQRYVCADCHFQWHTDEQLAHNQEVQRAAYQVERDRVRQRDGLMGSAEIAQAREALGLTQREAARLFGGGFNAFNKYESGEVLQSQAMDRLLKMAVAIGKEKAIPMLEAISNGEPLAIAIACTAPMKANTEVIYVTRRSADATYLLVGHSNVGAIVQQTGTLVSNLATQARPLSHKFTHKMKEMAH